jgi:4'-phosphopantetheinyl transferase superfamily
VPFSVVEPFKPLSILSGMPAEEVHVWRAELDRAASRRALRQVLAQYLDEEPATIELRLGEHGKPALVDPAASLRFNLSHSGGLVLIAIARDREIGVDVERIDPRRDVLRLGERALEPAAAAAIRAARPSDRPAIFHGAWARREAIAKCHGVGLRAPLPPSPVAVSTIDVGPGFAAAVAVSGEPMPRLRLRALDTGSHRASSHRQPACVLSNGASPASA